MPRDPLRCCLCCQVERCWRRHVETGELLCKSAAEIRSTRSTEALSELRSRQKRLPELVCQQYRVAEGAKGAGAATNNPVPRDVTCFVYIASIKVYSLFRPSGEEGGRCVPDPSALCPRRLSLFNPPADLANSHSPLPPTSSYSPRLSCSDPFGPFLFSYLLPLPPSTSPNPDPPLRLALMRIPPRLFVGPNYRLSPLVMLKLSQLDAGFC